MPSSSQEERATAGARDRLGIAARRWRLSLQGWLTGCGVLGAVIVLVDVFGSTSLHQVATTCLIYLVLAVGVQTFMGSSGIVTFGHIAFASVGAYAAGILTTAPSLKASIIPRAPAVLRHVSMGFLPATFAAVGFVALLAALVGLALVRLSPDALPLATLGLLIVVFVIANNWTQITNGSASFYGLPSYTNLWSAFAFAVAAMLVARVFRDSRLGVELRASRNDELAASSTGVDVFRVRYAGWVLSAAIVAAGGSLYAHSVGVISPNLFSFDLTFAVLTIVIIGGQSVSGALVGALVATTVTEILRRVENNYTIGGHDLFGLSKIGSGLMILIVLALRPGGLLGRWELDEVVGRTVRLRIRPNGGAIGRDTHS